jgi:signal transduction histidine kinase
MTMVGNAVVANYSNTIPIFAWFFVYIVFAHLVLDLSWAILVAVIGTGLMTFFTVIHLTHLVRFIHPDPVMVDRNILIGSPITLFFAFTALLYLLTVYRRLRDVMFRSVLESNSEKSQLVGIMSHDMRNYLGAVQNLCSLLRDELQVSSNGESNENVIHNIGLVEQASGEALALVEEVVAASRDASDGELYLEEIEITRFITPILQRYQVIARSKGVKFVMSSDTEEVCVAINRSRFSRVIENLLSNARKFSRQGDTVTISAKCSDGSVIISVADTGIGIPPEMQDKVFEPFTKAGRAGTANEKSIGLGMSIVKKLVEQHGGSIWLSSEVGKGTTFFIRLPGVKQGSVVA